jgi:orotate phosphoribosyltransferase
MYDFSVKKTKLFTKSLYSLCNRLKINIIAGPVLSGAVIAQSVSTYSLLQKRHIQALFIPKEKSLYKCRAHVNEIKITSGFVKGKYRILLVDDCFSSGKTIVEACKELKDGEWLDKGLLVGLAFSYDHFTEQDYFPKMEEVLSYNSKLRLFSFNEEEIRELIWK